MPLPTPSDGETEQDWQDRCMKDSKMIEEFPDEAQRLAVCQSQFDGESFTAESFEEFYGQWAVHRENVLSVQAVPDGERVQIKTDNELSEFPGSIREACQSLPSCVLDAVTTEDKGHVIDVLEYEGEDVREKPLHQRESILRSLPFSYGLQLCKPAKSLASDKVGLKFDIQDFLDEGVNTVIVRETDSIYDDVASQAFISIINDEESEAPATESIRESVSLAIREADTENGLEIILIRAGKSLNEGENGHIYYSPDELQSAVDRGVFEGAPIHMFSFEACDPNSGLCSTIRDHLPEGVLFEIDQGRIPHPTDHIAGYLWDVEWDSELEAIVSRNPQFVDNDKGKEALSVVKASLNGESNHPLGVSIVASGRREPSEIDGESVTAVKDIQEIDAWLDIVDHPAAGGAFRLSEAEKHLSNYDPTEDNMPNNCKQFREAITEQLKELGWAEEQISEAFADVMVSGEISPEQMAQFVSQALQQMESQDDGEGDDSDNQPSMESIHETYKLAFQKANENELDSESVQKLLDEVNGQALNESTLDQLVEKYLPSEEPKEDEEDPQVAETQQQLEAVQRELTANRTENLLAKNSVTEAIAKKVRRDIEDKILSESEIQEIIDDYTELVTESLTESEKLARVDDNPDPDNDEDRESAKQRIGEALSSVYGENPWDTKE